MRAAVAVTAVVLVGLSVPARAQVASARSILEIRPAFSSFTASASPRREIPSQVKWGLIIGGVTGAVTGAIVVSRNSHCRKMNEWDWDCVLEPLVVMGGALVGGIGGMLVGGSIGKAMAKHADFDVGGARLRMGVRLPL